VLQVRAKRLGAAEFLALADDVVRAAADYGGTVIVNDRVDIARLCRAGGVHVGQADLPPRDARAQLGPDAIVGFSTHTIAQIDDAVREPLSYIAVGPVFGTATKDTGYEAVGLDLVRAAVARAAGRPVVAIGGITLERAPSVLAAGASAVAVISDLITGCDPRQRVAAYCRATL
jgi:thiamine-phosphate pyrophosphorylase